MDDSDRSKHIRTRAAAIGEQGRKLLARARAMPPGAMRDMLEGQAAILLDAAGDLEARALDLAPPLGTA
jgi:hypothetical protein